MSERWLRLVAMLTSLVAAPAAAVAEDWDEDAASQSPSDADVSAEARGHVARHYPGAVIRWARQESADAWTVEIATAELTGSGAMRQVRRVSFDPAGNVIGERETIATGTVPPVVVAALKRQFGKVALWQAERVTERGQRSWQLGFSEKDLRGTAIVQEDGRFVSASLVRRS